MINPETLGLVLAMAQGKEMGSLDQLILKKIAADLQQGIRVTDETVGVVTRLGEDLFFIHIGLTVLAPDTSFKGYSLHNVEVRRGSNIWPKKDAITDTKELWKFMAETGDHPRKSFSVRPENGGGLEETEFWRRYFASVVDEAATTEYAEGEARLYNSLRFIRSKVRMTWVSDESPVIPEN